MTDSYIYNKADNKYYQKLAAYGEPTEINDIDLNSEWISDTTDDEYKYFKSNSIEFEPPFSQCKVTWSNLTSITFKYMSSSDMGDLFVGNLDGENFTLQTNPDEHVYLSTEDKTSGRYNEFTIECDESEHHIWFAYVKNESATDEDRGFIGVPKSVTPILDVKQGTELHREYQYGGVSAENGQTYDIKFSNVTLPNDNIVTVYEDFQKVEKTISYEYVDLGLSVKWATCNIGATSETESGVYFQWGETSGVSETLVGKYSDENYSWESYTLCNGSDTTLTKYCSNSSYGTVDNKRTLEPIDDAATQIMGSDWRMPTATEFGELYDNTTNEWTTMNGVNGRKFTGSNGNSIFIPATGYCHDGTVSRVGSDGAVWNSVTESGRSYNAYNFLFDSKGFYISGSHGKVNRCGGYVVRGVRK